MLRVYPRVGGETEHEAAWAWRSLGLSPRGRGNHRLHRADRPRLRSIPAWAGKPVPSRRPAGQVPVYPRVGGETLGMSRRPCCTPGLSPRGRGNRRDERAPGGLPGSIPAWAGKPQITAPRPPTRRVYPRVGGETMRGAAAIRSARGLSPRGRGNLLPAALGPQTSGSIPAWAGKPLAGVRPGASGRVYPRVGGETRGLPVLAHLALGLSPRGRGNRRGELHQPPQHGSIPAWAGKPYDRAEHYRLQAVYPRVGGETDGQRRPLRHVHGLSPRGRGNHRRDHLGVRRQRSIPAWAGKPCRMEWRRTRGWVYPRVGGETSVKPHRRMHGKGLSPRGRGNHRPGGARCAAAGSIPAWAGKPSSTARLQRTAGVYPRVGGETLQTSYASVQASGLSPRGRGNHPLQRRAQPLAGSIPAWAGKPDATRGGRHRGWVYPRVGGETRRPSASRPC